MCDAETERHNARMSKVADAQAEDFANRAFSNASDDTLQGSLSKSKEKKPSGLRGLLGSASSDTIAGPANSMNLEDDMAVLTNSPIHITNNHPPAIVPPGMSPWAKALIWLAGILALLLVILFLIVYGGGGDNGGGDVPDVVPPVQNGDIHLEDIPGKDRMMQGAN